MCCPEVLTSTLEGQQRGFALGWLWSGPVDWKPSQTSVPAAARSWTDPSCLISGDCSSALHDHSALSAKALITGTVRRFLLRNSTPVPSLHGNAVIPLSSKGVPQCCRKKKLPSSNCLSAASAAHLGLLTGDRKVLQTLRVYHFFLLVDLFWLSSVITIISKYLLL